MEQKTIIRFMSGVDEQSARNFINIVENEFKNGVRSFRILISSPGGYVDPGISIFNYLKGIPANIETVNFGSVDSISTVIFCAGTKRISVPNARFLIHDIFRITPQQSVNLSEAQLDEWLNGLRMDRRNIAKVIAETTKKKVEEIESLMRNGKVLNPAEAQEIGLVNEISQNIIQEGLKLISIN